MSEQGFKVYIANIKEKKWQGVFAHVVSIDDFQFSFIPFRKSEWQIQINVSEITSGCHLIDLWIDPFTFMECNTKEKTVALFEKEAEILVEYIEKFGKEKLKARIADRKAETFAMCGPMPEIKEEDIHE